MKKRDAIKISALGLESSTISATPYLSRNDPSSENFTKSKIMIFGAHPDDPETGCGDLMKLLSRKGHRVLSVYLTKGEAGIDGISQKMAAEIRMKEAKVACKILIAKPMFLLQIDGSTVINKNRYTEIAELIEIE